MTKKIPKHRKPEAGSRAFDSLKRSQVYDSLNDHIDFIHDPKIEPGPAYILGLGYQKVALAKGIEDFLRRIQRDTTTPFELIRMARHSPVVKANPLGQHFGTVIRSALWDDLRHQFSEEVQLVLEGVRALNYDPYWLNWPESRDPSSGRFGFELFNDLVAWLRTALLDEGYIARRRRRREQARRHFLSGKTYIDQLFDRYARLLVLRIDLGYVAWPNRASAASLFDAGAGTAADPETQTEEEPEDEKEKRVAPGKSLPRARSDLAKFLNNRRSNSIFEHMVGHLWKLEEGETKGYHFHLFAFFDGSKVQQDAHLAKQLGEYWQNVITKGDGVYYNCNAHKSRYRKLGIGRIDHDDDQLRENLLLALAYVTKADQYLRVRTDAARIFGKGVVKPRVSAAGRPRKAGPDEDTPKNAGDELDPDDDDDVNEAT